MTLRIGAHQEIPYTAYLCKGLKTKESIQVIRALFARDVPVACNQIQHVPFHGARYARRCS